MIPAEKARGVVLRERPSTNGVAIFSEFHAPSLDGLFNNVTIGFDCETLWPFEIPQLRRNVLCGCKASPALLYSICLRRDDLLHLLLCLLPTLYILTEGSQTTVWVHSDELIALLRAEMNKLRSMFTADEAGSLLYRARLSDITENCRLPDTAWMQP